MGLHFVNLSTYKPARGPISPYDGPIVKLFDGVHHADPIDDGMLAEGEYVIFDDFRNATAGMGVHRNNASQTFNRLFSTLLRHADDQLGLYGMASPYYDYYRWGTFEQPERRAQLLLETQAVADIYEVNKDLPKSPLTQQQLLVTRFVLHEY
jgi:hypothetical protein